MKKNKFLEKIAEDAVKISFIGDKLNKKAVFEFVNLFKKLPSTKSILILEAYIKYLKRVNAKFSAVVESAIPLTSLELKEIIKSTGEKNIINLENIVNQEVLGGIKIKIGDQLIDFSIKSRISQLREGIIK